MLRFRNNTGTSKRCHRTDSFTERAGNGHAFITLVAMTQHPHSMRVRGSEEPACFALPGCRNVAQVVRFMTSYVEHAVRCCCKQLRSRVHRCDCGLETVQCCKRKAQSATTYCTCLTHSMTSLAISLPGISSKHKDRTILHPSFGALYNH